MLQESAYAVLIAIDDAPGVTQAHLINTLGHPSPVAIKTALDRLQTAGYIQAIKTGEGLCEKYQATTTGKTASALARSLQSMEGEASKCPICHGFRAYCFFNPSRKVPAIPKPPEPRIRLEVE